VPTKLFVRKLAIQDLVSMAGGVDGEDDLTTVGSPTGQDCFDRSKSVNMMCPVWCNRMSSNEEKNVFSF